MAYTRYYDYLWVIKAFAYIGLLIATFYMEASVFDLNGYAWYGVKHSYFSRSVLLLYRFAIVSRLLCNYFLFVLQSLSVRFRISLTSLFHGILMAFASP
jgi:hypothetical protein